MAKRVGNISSEQKKEIIESARTLWMSLSESLNTIPGAKKHWKQWRKAWQDLKGNAKKKGSGLKTDFRQTGGGPPLTDIKITKEEQKVLNIIGTTATEGHPTIIESGCSFAFDANHGNESVILEYVVNPNMDHDYVHQSEALAGTSPHGNSDVIVNTDLTKITNTPKRNGMEKQTNLKSARCVQRLEKSISVSTELLQVTKSKVENKENYLSKKLNLLERDVKAKEKIAEHLAMLCDYFKCPKDKSSLDEEDL